MDNDSAIDSDHSDDKKPANTVGRGWGMYPQEVVDLAFQYWLFRANRSIPKTVEMLANECDSMSLPTPNAATVNRWSRAESWDIRGNALIRQLAPAIDETDAADLLILRGDVKRQLHRLVTEGATEEDRQTIRALDLAARVTGLTEPESRPVMTREAGQSADCEPGESPEVCATRLSRERLARRRQRHG